MTSVPKPLKFLRPFYSTLEDIRREWSTSLPSEKVQSLLDMAHSPGCDTSADSPLLYP